jgi:hypothetical protein
MKSTVEIDIEDKTVEKNTFHQLIDVLTAIAYYADACGEAANQQAHPVNRQIAAWAARIGTQVQRGDAIIRRYLERAARGNETSRLPG